MQSKPTHEELVQRVKDLEHKAVERKCTEQALQKAHEELERRIEERTAELLRVNKYLNQEIEERKETEVALSESEKLFRHAFENANIGVCLVNTDGHFIKVNNRLREIFGYSKEELEGMTVNDIAHPEDAALSPQFYRRSMTGEVENTVYEKRYIHKQGHLVWGQVSSSIVRNSEGDPLYFISHVQDITQKKLAQETLAQRDKELEIKSVELEEINTALRVMLRDREKDRAEIEERVMANVNQLVLPHLDRLNKGQLDEKEKTCLNIAQSNLKEIISPFARKLSTKYLNLTPAEIKVADFVRHGKSTKAIAGLFNLSKGTIERHREGIRKKLGIKNTKTNLRTLLLSIE